MTAPHEPTDLRSALLVMTGGDPDRLRLVAGAGSAGARILERYVAVPGLADPRALLPLDATAPAWRAVLRPHAKGAAGLGARAAASMVSLAAPVRLRSMLLRDLVSVEAVRGDEGETPLRRFLADILGRADFVTSLRLAPGRPNGKPVAQVVAHSGAVLAYAKFGWEDLTRTLVQREAAVLAELAPSTRGMPLTIPTILHSGAWGAIETLVLAPLSQAGWTPRSAAAVPIAASVALAALGPRRVERLAPSAFWRRTAAQAAQVAPVLGAHARQVALEACRSVEARWGNVELPFGWSHGDWIPPNLSVRTDGAFNVWDWERGEADVPLGVDAMQFLLFLELQRRPEHVLGGRLLGDARDALARHGLDPGTAPLLIALSLLRSILWFGEAREAGRTGKEDLRFVQALEAVLQTFDERTEPRRRRGKPRIGDGLEVARGRHSQ